MIPKSALLLALRIACIFEIAKILAQDLDGTRQENQRDISLNGTCEHVKSPGGVKDNNILSTAEETALGQDVVASTLQDNCGEVRPEDADVMWAECIFTATRVTYFSFSLKQENADPRVFSQNNQRVSYDAKGLNV
ncbi:hypothetical protein RRG08_063526 [Elysia crispata]|uniref:Uncharacterized protein n=1 Tax=Elysia crispata TaxID=231223 RepID=A0AAE1B2M0_9GAST|nr:hypothetical protein RRG08_063526 [Elysia crispata]